MNKLKYIALLAVFIFMNSIISGQEVDDQLRKIDLKLKNDKRYLNLHYIVLMPTEISDSLLRLIPRVDNRDPFEIQRIEGVRYRLVFLMEGIGIDSLELLYVDQIKEALAAGESLFGAGGADADTNKALNFKDIYQLKKNNREIYNALFKVVDDYLKLNEDAPPPSLLGIKPDADLKTGLGMSARDNEDYLNFARANDAHWYPREKKQQRTSIRQVSEESSIRLDLSFSRLAFSHKVMDFSLGGASLEFGVGDKVLNILPWQGLNAYGGLRLLLHLAEGRDINKSTYIDTKLAIRLKLNTLNIYEKQPNILADSPLLNVGTAFIGDFSITRPFSLPFFNLYFATGKADFENPFVTFSDRTKKYAYFTFSQMELTMSFFWNSSDKRIIRFRMDLGAAYHDVVKATYNLTDQFVESKSILGNLSPVVNLYFDFAPNNDPLLGNMIKFYDSQIKLITWLRILEFSETHTIRFESIFISSPVARKTREWENSGGVMFQFRYRLGI